MQIKARDQGKYFDFTFARGDKRDIPQLHKNNFLQSQELGLSLRRHSVFGNASPQDYL